MIAGYFDDASAQHDSLAMAAVIAPGVITTGRHQVEIETAGQHTRGMTVVDYATPTGRGNADVAFGVDVDGFRTLLDERFSRLADMLAQP
ncbi:MAG: nucleoside hydrolase [Propioniciclava sp.]